jgi:hypothetical protein
MNSSGNTTFQEIRLRSLFAVQYGDAPDKLLTGTFEFEDIAVDMLGCGLDLTEKVFAIGYS